MTTQEERLEALAGVCPWPPTRPDLPEDWHGWFGGHHESMLRRHVGPDTRLIVELGSWMGRSTRFLLEAAPNATVVAVDHWAGSAEHFADPELSAMVPRSYDQFVANLWGYRSRLVPLRASTLVGMAFVANLRLEPDLVYVDAAHDTASVIRDVGMADNLFPGAQIVGDDWNWGSVREGVEKYAGSRGYAIKLEGNAWSYHRGDMACR